MSVVSLSVLEKDREKHLTFTLQNSQRHAVHMSVNPTEFVSGAYAVVIVDTSRFLSLWRAEPTAFHAEIANGDPQTWPRYFKFARASEGFSRGSKDPVPLADVTCEPVNGATPNSSSPHYVLFSNGITRTIWLMTNDFQAFPVLCPLPGARELHRLAGMRGTSLMLLPLSVEQAMSAHGALSPNVDVPRETPAGFLLHAQEFLIAAELVSNKVQGVSFPAYFLYGRSIELSLKAFLLKSGLKISELRSTKRFGHNLVALLDEAAKKGLNRIVPMDQTEIGVIHALNEDYSGKRFEYRITGGTYLLPLIDVTENITRRLVADLHEECIDGCGL